MKTPNNHYLNLGGGFYQGKESVILIAGSILRTCEALFETAVTQKTSVNFEFDESDFEYLRGQFPGIEEETKLVEEFLDGIINMRLKLPYGISTVLKLVGSNLFWCRVIHELPMYD